MFDIKALRIKKGISQTELANKIGVTLRTIQHWEKGSKNITIDKLERINNFFGLKMNLYIPNEQINNLLLVEEDNSDYKVENDSKIKELEDKVKYQEKQLKKYKDQIDSLKKINIKPDSKE